MGATFDIEEVQIHEFRVRADVEGQPVESLFRMTDDLLTQLDLPDTDEITIVDATARFLSKHQSVRDFPPMIDLEDLMATYTDFPQQIKDLLPATE